MFKIFTKTENDNCNLFGLNDIYILYMNGQKNRLPNQIFSELH